MKNSNINHHILSACLALMLFTPTCYAEIFKWVDSNGRTHYSENEKEAGAAKAEKIKVVSPASSASVPPAQSWSEQVKQLDKRQQEKPKPTAVVKPKPKPKALSDGTSDGTDASRCRLARDVISGAVVHPNGAPTDQYDRDTAQNEIRSYCH